MKLTIKNKKPIHSQFSGSQANSSYIQNQASGLCGADQSKRHKVVMTRNYQQRNMQNLIRFDCQNYYSRVGNQGKKEHNENVQDLYESIIDAVQTTHFRYNQCIGFLCAHAVHHYKEESEREHVIYRFIQAYRPIFQRPQLAEAILEETLRRFCLYLADSDIDPKTLPLQKIARRYQQSLLLEFVPVEYSQFIVGEYLARGDPEQYIELATSVMHFIVNIKNPLNSAHCTELMLSPYMGVVQWPIIISHRKMFQSMMNPNEQNSVKSS